MSVVLLYPRGCDFSVVRTCAQNTWGLANVRFYSEFTSLEPRYLDRIRDPGLEGELTRGYFSQNRARAWKPRAWNLRFADVTMWGNERQSCVRRSWWTRPCCFRDVRRGKTWSNMTQDSRWRPRNFIYSIRSHGPGTFGLHMSRVGGMRARAVLNTQWYTVRPFLRLVNIVIYTVRPILRWILLNRR